MITCNKCGYDKAVQGLNEIWCDKCDATKHGPSPKSFPPIQARVEHPWEQADEYFDKNDICRFVNELFSKKIPGYWFHLVHGCAGQQDMWRATIGEIGGSSIVSYAHQNLQSLCCILEKAFDERPDTPGDGIMLVVSTAVEDYFNED